MLINCLLIKTDNSASRRCKDLDIVFIVVSQEHKSMTKFSPGGSEHVRCHRCHSLADFFIEVVHGIDRILIDPAFHIAPQNKKKSRCWSSTSNPVIGEGIIQVGPDSSRTMRRRSVQLKNEIRYVVNLWNGINL